MHLIGDLLCTCRDKANELTLMGETFRKLEDFKIDRPDVNIVEFFKENDIHRMCCRRTMMTPYTDILKSDKDRYKFRINVVSQDGESKIPDIGSYLNIIPTRTINFPTEE
jgi:DNA-directed RNA polymerase subunit N (RpoN/RPB10)